MTTTKTSEVNELLTAKEISKMLKVTTRAVWNYRDAGAMPQPVRIIGAVRWRASDVEAWIMAGCPNVRRTGWRAEQ